MRTATVKRGLCDLGASAGLSPGRDRRLQLREFARDHLVYGAKMLGYATGRLRQAVVGLDAAHVRWHQFQRPDTVENGIALCSLHHRMLDKGAWSIGDDWQVLVSQAFTGESPAAQDMIERAGKPIVGPQAGQPRVELAHLEWHQHEVFQGPERPVVGTG